MNPTHSNRTPSKLTTSQEQKSQNNGVLTRLGKHFSCITHLAPFKSINRSLQNSRKGSSETDIGKSESFKSAKTLFKTQDCVALIFSFLETQEVKATSIAACGLIPNTLYLHDASERCEIDKMTPTYLSNIPIGNRLILRRDSLYTMLLGHHLLSYQNPGHGTLTELSLHKKSSEIAFSLLLATENPTEVHDPTVFATGLLHAGGDKDKKEAIEKLANSSQSIQHDECYRVAAKMVNKMPMNHGEELSALRSANQEGHLYLVKIFASKLPKMRWTESEKSDLRDSINFLFLFARENRDEALETLKEVETYNYDKDLKFHAALGALEGGNLPLFNCLIEGDPNLTDRLRGNHKCLRFARQHNLSPFP